MKTSVDTGNGNNWNPINWPYFGNSNLAGSSLTLYANLYNLRYFSLNGSGGYDSQFGDLSTLVHDSVNHRFRLTEADGTLFVFHDLTDTNRPGGFLSMTAPGGNALTVTQEVGSRIGEVQRSLTQGGTTVVDSFLYDYFASGEQANRLHTCTLRRQINGGSWQNIVQAEYSYYGSADTFGGLGDLRTATRKVWQSSAWADFATDYYRYYKTGNAKGSAHDLQFICGPEAFAKLQANTSDPFTASEATVSLYADNYFEYNFNDQVVLERVFAGSKTMTFSYARNPHFSSSSSSSSASVPPPQNYNAWVSKTIQTRPDDSQVVTFANFAGQTMLSVLRAGGSGSSSSSGTPQQWCTFIKYDDDGREILVAHPSAVTGYDESYDDLLHYSAITGKYQYLRDNDGFIELSEYYPEPTSSSSSGSSTSSSSSGSAVNTAPTGYLKAQKIQHGQLGTPIILKTLEYTSHTQSTTTIYPILRESTYPDDTNPAATITTSYAYTFYSGSTQIQQRTTTLPVISTSQNGSGSSNTAKEYFDSFGYLTWSMDPRGFITHYVYDIATGALIQQIEDVDTSVVSGAPSGWTTPAGGGLNQVTDFEADNQGRVTQSLGPSHVIDLAGTATNVRSATWTVYDDPQHTTRSAQGYATGAGPSYSYTLINPVRIRITNPIGQALEEISAIRTSTTGKLLPSDSFSQSSYVRWTTYQYTDCCLLQSKRVYHSIPSSGTGGSGANFDETDFGYDVMKRQNQVITPGGTITYEVFDIRSLPGSMYLGTNDTGATDYDPTGGGATGNNMVLITTNVYDNGIAGGDGNLTEVTQSVDATTARLTGFTYDWRDRLLTTSGEQGYFEKRYYDNLNRMVKVERYDTSASGNLLARSETRFDDLSRVYRTIQYGVDPSTGTVFNSLTSNTWYDPSGNVVKTLAAGSQLFTKTTYDSLNRPTVIHAGYGTDANYADIFSVTGNVILEQSESSFDAAGNLIQVTNRQRYNTAATSQTGALQTPATNPKARVTYSANYSDAIGRPQASADYGTNGGSALSRSSTVPTRSDAILVTSQVYDTSENLQQTTDPAGTVTRYNYDNAGRRIQTIENFQSSSSSSSSSVSGCSPSADTNRTTNLTYTSDGQVHTLEVLNIATGSQLTEYVYGTTLSDSDVAASLLLRSTIFPGSVSGSDQVWITYNRQAERTNFIDQNGTVHHYVYDLLGRLILDQVPTLAAGVDGTVLCLETAYDVRGMVAGVNSWWPASPVSSQAQRINSVQFTYNDFGQSIKTYQAHSGYVNPATTTRVQMGYANGATNTIRPTDLTYPNGRVLSYDYGTSGGINDQASRIASILDNDVSTTHLADYEYLGLGAVVQQTSPQPALRYTLISLTGGNDPDTGDIYAGFDRFGRVKDVRWRNVTAGTDLSRIQYGYDRDSNRIWRENSTDPARHYDWRYLYDALQRVGSGERGQLNTGHTGITNPQFGQCWTLDETGNWQAFRQDDSGSGSWSLMQSREANSVNEIMAVGATTGDQWATPDYDRNGNMTIIPRPDLGRPSWANLMVDQWSSLTVDEWSELEVAPKLKATYDSWNRLVSLTDGGSGLLIQKNEYDGRNYRTIRKSYISGSLDETRHFIYSDDWQVVEVQVNSSTTPNRQFVWGVRYIDDLVIRDRSVVGVLDERHYGMQDANWNVTAIVNNTGAVAERYEYDPYGVATVLSPTFVVQSASNFDWETTYAAYQHDTLSAYYAVRNRYYQPNVGVWLTRDPLSAFDESDLTPLYEYVESNGIRYVDPYGLGKIGAIKLIYKMGGRIVKTLTLDPDTAKRLLKNKTKKGAGPNDPRIFVQCDKGDAAAKKLAKEVSPINVPVKHPPNQIGHPGHYHPASGYKPSGAPETAGTPHIGSDYRGAPMMIGGAAGGSLLDDVQEIAIELSPAGDIRTIVSQGPELIDATKDLAEILKNEGIRGAELQAKEREGGIDRFVGDKTSQPTLPCNKRPLTAGSWRQSGFGF